MEIYQVKPEDLIRDITDFPIEVVQLMINEQVAQGNPADVTVFQNIAWSIKDDGGFNWSDTPYFREWNNAISHHKFNELIACYTPIPIPILYTEEEVLSLCLAAYHLRALDNAIRSTDKFIEWFDERKKK